MWELYHGPCHDRSKVTHFIPNGFKTEDQDGYYELVDQHRNWLDNHRNIPILNVETINQYTQDKNANQISLKVLLLGVPGIERCNYDSVNKRVNVSVTASTFLKVSKAITAMLSTSGLPFQPLVKQNYNPTGSLGSKKTGTSKYLDTVSKYKKVWSPTSSIATSVGTQSQASIRSIRTWSTIRIPTEIDFSEDNFPPLQNKSDSPITATSDRIIPTSATNYLGATAGGYSSSFKPVARQGVSPYTTDQTESSLTIQSAISQALAAAREDHMKMLVAQQEVHRKEIEKLTVTFPTQMKSFEANIQRNSNNNPSDRMEFLEDKMERNSNQMDARLDKIIDLLLLNQRQTITEPSPFRKKTRQYENYDEVNMDIDHFKQLSSDRHDPQRNEHHPDDATAPRGAKSPNNEGISSSKTRTVNLDDTSSSFPSPIEVEDPMNQEHEMLQNKTTPPGSPLTKPPPLPDSPTPDHDATWLKRQASASIAFTEKAKTLLNPYRTAQETLKAQMTKTNRISSLNSLSTPMGVHLTTLSSSRSDKASRGRED